MNREQLDLLLAQGLSYRQVAVTTGVSYTTVRYWARKFGLRSKHRQIPSRRWNDDQLRAAVQQSVTIADVLRELGLTPRGSNYPGIKQAIRRLQLDTSHFTGRGHGKSRQTSARPLRDILVKSGRREGTSRLKKRMIRAGLLEERCAICGIDPAWNGQPLVLRLDHINGDPTDHRRRNLRLVCPNCDSQLPTYCARNKRP